jgi:hypothetical protein
MTPWDPNSMSLLTELARVLLWRGYKDLAPTEHLRVLRLLVTAATDLKS